MIEHVEELLEFEDNLWYNVFMKNCILKLGDCRDVMDKMIAQNIFVDLTVTSPPYDNLRTYNDGLEWNESIWKDIILKLSSVTVTGGVVVWVVGDETKNFCESLSSFKRAIYFVEQGKFNLLDTMIYEKSGGPSPYPNMRRYSPWFEYMFVFSNGKPKTFNPIKDKPTRSGGGKVNSGNTARQASGITTPTGSYITSDFTMRHNVWKYAVGCGKDTSDKIALGHPARFPEQLANDHILSWSNPGDIVFDPFMGSGTTGKMALLGNRKFIGIEKDLTYFNLSKTRLESCLTAKIVLTKS